MTRHRKLKFTGHCMLESSALWPVYWPIREEAPYITDSVIMRCHVRVSPVSATALPSKRWVLSSGGTASSRENAKELGSYLLKLHVTDLTWSHPGVTASVCVETPATAWGGISVQNCTFIPFTGASPGEDVDSAQWCFCPIIRITRDLLNGSESLRSNCDHPDIWI